MSNAERLSLCADDVEEFLESRALMDALQGFLPKSQTMGMRPLSPDLSTKEVIELFKDHETLFIQESLSSVKLVLRKGRAFVKAEFNSGGLMLRVLSLDTAAKEVIEDLFNRFEPYKFVNVEPDGVWVDFTFEGSNGVSRHAKFIRSPRWTDIHGVPRGSHWRSGGGNPFTLLAAPCTEPNRTSSTTLWLRCAKPASAQADCRAG